MVNFVPKPFLSFAICFLAWLPLSSGSDLLENNPFLPQGFNQNRNNQQRTEQPRDEPTAYEFRGVVGMGDRTLISIVELESGRGLWLSPGQTRGGIRLVEFIPDTRQVVLEARGRTQTLSLREATFSFPGGSMASTGRSQQTGPGMTGASDNVGPGSMSSDRRPRGSNASTMGGSSSSNQPGSSGMPTPEPRVRPNLPPTMENPGVPPPFTPQIPAHLQIPNMPDNVREAVENPPRPNERSGEERRRSEESGEMREPPANLPPGPSSSPPPGRPLN